MKTYIVTDPCYIIPHNEWANMFKRNTLHANIVNYLEGLTKNEAWCYDTGYGDWGNRMEGDGVHEDHDAFTADAGLVCVCEYTEDVKYHLMRENTPDYCYALVDMDGYIYVRADESNKHWTVIHITDGTSKAKSLDD